MWRYFSYPADPAAGATKLLHLFVLLRGGPEETRALLRRMTMQIEVLQMRLGELHSAEKLNVLAYQTRYMDT
jgi:hypothetical protein